MNGAITTVTRHAKRRIKQRMHKGWQKASDDAFLHGLRHHELKGPLRRHIDGMYATDRGFGKTHHTYLVRKGYCFVFHNTVLITVWRLPRHLLKSARQQAEQRETKQHEC